MRRFEVLEWLNRTTLDIIGEAAFGAPIDSLYDAAAPLREAYGRLFAFDLTSRINYGIQLYVPGTMHISVKMNRDVATAGKSIVEISEGIVESKRSGNGEKVNARDIMSMIVRDNEKTKAQTGEHLSPETLRDQVMKFLGAGHDTTATGLAWTLHLLAKHPEVQRKLRKEIESHIPELFSANIHNISAEDFRQVDVDHLPYVDKVCRESLRYVPPVPTTVRQSIQNDELGGYFIPGGTTVYILANTINRLPTFWGEDADVFDPDRWDRLPEGHPPNAYTTFLHRPRGCIGRKFSETEMKVILCCLAL